MYIEYRYSIETTFESSIQFFYTYQNVFIHILDIWECLVFVLGEGNGNPLQYSCLENPMDREAWWAAVHGVSKSRTRLSDFTFTFHFHALEKEMATHSSVLAWRIPGKAEPVGLLSVGSQSRTRLKRLSSSSSSSSLCLRRRQWQPTPVLLPGKSHSRRSLVGCSPWGH